MIKLINKSLELEHSDDDFDYIQVICKLLKSNELYNNFVKLSSDISSLDKIQTIVDRYP
jgi:hypothetical protein